MIEEEIARLRGTLELRVDGWFRELRRVEQSIDKLTQRTMKVRLELDLSVFNQQVALVQQQLRRLGVNVSPAAVAASAGGGPARVGVAMAGGQAAPAAGGGVWMNGVRFGPGGIPGTQYRGQAYHSMPYQWQNQSSRSIPFGPTPTPALGVTGALAGIAATGGMYKSAFDTSVGTELAMAGIRRVTGFSPGQMGGVESGLQQIAYDSPGASRGDVFGIAFEGAKQGVGTSPEALLEFTRTMSRLSAVVDDMDVSTLVTQMARMANIFDVGTDKIGHMASAVVKLDQATTATSSDVINIAGRLAGPAKATGMKLPDVLAVAAGIKDVGGLNEAASSSMIRMFGLLADPQGRAGMAGALGLDPGGLKAAFNASPNATLAELVSRVQAVPEGSDRLATIRDMGITGVRDQTMMGRMSSGKWGQVPHLATLAAGEMQSPTTLTEGVAIRAETTKSSLEQLTDAIGNLSNEAVKASGALSAAGSLSSRLAEWAQNASQNPQATASLLGLVNPLAGLKAQVDATANSLFGPTPAQAAAAAAAGLPIPGKGAGAGGAGLPGVTLPNALSGMFGTSQEHGVGGVLGNFGRSLANSPLAQQMLGFGQDVARGLPGLNPLQGLMEMAQRQRPDLSMMPSAAVHGDASGLVTSQQVNLLNGDVQRAQLEQLREIRGEVAGLRQDMRMNPPGAIL